MTKRMPLYLLPAFFALFAVQASAQVWTTYDGCVDTRGAPVRAISDGTLATVVEARIERGVAEIRYNRDRLPRLLPESRDFLFAHECARVNLGLPLGRDRTQRDAREADCEAAAMLLRSGLVDDDKLAAVEADLALSPPEWAAVPGPVRHFVPTSCAAEILARPSQTSPSAAQANWNVCVRRCAERLRACTGCAGLECFACGDGYERCTSLCDVQ